MPEVDAIQFWSMIVRVTLSLVWILLFFFMYFIKIIKIFVYKTIQYVKCVRPSFKSHEFDVAKHIFFYICYIQYYYENAL